MLASPLLQRRGRCAIKKSCEATFDAQTGWSKTFLTTPSAPNLKDAFGDIFFEVASTPPLEEGTGRGLTISSWPKSTLTLSIPIGICG